MSKDKPWRKASETRDRGGGNNIKKKRLDQRLQFVGSEGQLIPYIHEMKGDKANYFFL